MFLVSILLLAGCSKKKSEKPVEPYVQEREGIWVSADADAYVAIFGNGVIMTFDQQTLREGRWTEVEGGIAGTFTGGVVYGASQWEYHAEEYACAYVYDAEAGKLIAGDEVEYLPAVAAADFRAVGEHIDVYEEAGSRAWMSQMDMNMGAGTVLELWNGLEQQLFSYLMQTQADPEKLQEEENAWLAEYDKELDAVREENAGGSIAPLAVASKGSAMLQERVEELLGMIKE